MKRQKTQNSQNTCEKIKILGVLLSYNDQHRGTDERINM